MKKKHSYEAIVADRTSGKGCPFCAGRQIQIGFNDLATTNPEIAKEWDYAKNGSLTPQDISKGNQAKVWWKCEKGHSWKATVASRTDGRGCPYCAGKQIQVGFNDLATTHPEIAKEWDCEKNGSLTPQDVSKGSDKKVWWKCEKGHRYEATVASRTNCKSGCPICSNKKVLSGYNDLTTIYPEIAKDWDYKKNIDLKPEMLTPKSGRKVWWKCEKGHSYKTTVAKRTGDRRGCPYCSGHKILIGYNDLATTNPEIAKEWDYSKNGSLTPQNVSKGNETKVWWLCKKGHSYKQSLSDKTNGKGCPICTGKQILIGYNDLATTHPKIAKEWDYQKNKTLTPQNITKGSDTKVWWKCEQGHSYKSAVSNRISGRNCPICSGHKILIGYNDLATTNPEIAKEWDYLKNGSLTPQSITKGSNKKVWWKCEKGHRYEATVANRTNRESGCPYCSASHGEKTIDKVLNDLNLKYQTQVTFDGLTGINGGKLSYDFGIYENNKLLFLIEYQGIQHYVKIDFFGGEKKLEKQQFHDDLKREYAEEHNIPLLEIPYEITEYADIFSCIKNFYDHTFKN